MGRVVLDYKRPLSSLLIPSPPAPLPKGKGRRIRTYLYGFLVGCLLGLGFGPRAIAQVIPDNTLGAESSQVTPTVTRGLPSDRIDGGAIRGNNLFHSFQEFNVREGRGVYFSNPSQIENILSRVTGSNRSNILGTLGVLGNANLFLLNPNGIVFGPNARLDVRGSFVGSTADSVLFDNFEFSASNPQAPPLLTINVPIGLRFREPAAPIVVQGLGQGFGLGGITGSFPTGTGLQVDPGKTLAIAGGNVRLEGGILQAPGGRVEVAALAGNADIGLGSEDFRFQFTDIIPDESFAEGKLDFSAALPRGDVVITDQSGINVLSSGGGDIAINARNLEISGQSLLTTGITSGFGAPGIWAGNILMRATGATTIAQSRVENNVNPDASGNSGNIDLQSGTFSLIDDAQLSTSNFESGPESGFAGDVKVTANDRVSITDAAAYSNGFWGRVYVTSNTDSVDISNSLIYTEIEDDRTIPGRFNEIQINAPEGSVSLSQSTVSTTNKGTGYAGDVYIDARDRVSITSDSSILSNGFFGRVDITSGNNSVDISNSLITTTTQDNRIDPERFSSISINAPQGSISLRQSEISTTNTDVGYAGDIYLDARDRIDIVNSQITSEGNFGRIFMGSKQETDSGSSFSPSILTLEGDSTLLSTANKSAPETDAGSITIFAGDLVINEATLSSITFGSGNAGDISVETSRDIEFVDNEFFTNVLDGASGRGGNISIKAASFFLLNGSQLQTSILGPSTNNYQGNAGNVSLDVRGAVKIAALNRIGQPSGIFSNTGGDGNSGNISIQAQSLFIADGGIVTTQTSGAGRAGNIQVNATDSATFIGVAPIEVYDVHGDGQLRQQLRGGFSSGLFATSEENATGAGGTIELTTGTLRFSDGATLSARSRSSATGGDIIVNANTLQLTGGSQIVATAFETGAAGNVTVNITGSAEISGTDPTYQSRFDQIEEAFQNGLVSASAESVIDQVRIDPNNADSPAASGLFAQSRNPESQSGNIRLSAGSVSLTDGAAISTTSSNDNLSAFSEIVVEATAGSVLLDQATISATNTGLGFAGDIFIDARDSIDVSNSKITSEGEFGRIFLGFNTWGDISLPTAITLSNMLLSTTNFSSDGRAGDITIMASDTVGIADSRIFSDAYYADELGATGGQAGRISVTGNNLVNISNSQLTTESLNKTEEFGIVAVRAPKGSVIVQNQSLLSGTNFSSGFASDIILNALDKVAISNSRLFSDGFLGRILVGQSVASDETYSPRNVVIDQSILTTNNTSVSVEIDDTINAGNISIDATDKISIINYSDIEAVTGRRGNAGSIILNAGGDILLSSSPLFSTVESGGVGKGGNGGDIAITGRSLILADGSQLQTLVRKAYVQESENDSPESTLRNNAGRISINVSDQVMLSGSTNRDPAGNPGPFYSGIFSTVEPRSTGDGGNIDIRSQSLSLDDNATISATNRGQGAAGDINIMANSIRLDNQSTIAADTQGGQGNITLQAGNIQLRQASKITTNATAAAGGGNITLSSEFLIAPPNQNSDITANAEGGPGGQIFINVPNVFGIAALTREELAAALGLPPDSTELDPSDLPSNDITAISKYNPELSGQVTFNTAAVNQIQGFVDLPEDVVDPAALIAANPCVEGEQSEFVITGRGGVPPNPSDALSRARAETDWLQPLSIESPTETPPVPLPQTTRQSAVETQPDRVASPAANRPSLQPAQGWVINDRGQVTLVAYRPDPALPHRLPTPPVACPAR